MANNDRWREDQERNRYRDDVRRRGDRNPGYGRGSAYEAACAGRVRPALRRPSPIGDAPAHELTDARKCA
jgi:hypothetical protein